jgi:protein-S-isoprenylcysteine O-methyltransferase Ste14
MAMVRRSFGDVAGFLLLTAATAAYAPRNLLMVAGIGLALVAATLWVVARLQLGASFSRRVEVRGLVTTGLYSKLRHPIYVFVCLGILGLIVAHQDPALLTVWVLVVAGLIVKSRREEQTLLAAYGSEYEAYRRKTWF